MTPVNQAAPEPKSALAKGLEVLEAVLSHNRLSDIASSTGLSHSTVHRILNDLATTGWVHQDELRKYQLGPRTHALAVLLHDDGEISRQAFPFLEGLRDRTGMTVHFGLLKHDFVMYIVKLDGHGAYRMKSRVGGTVPLHCTAIGKSILSTLPDQTVRQTLGRAGMKRITPTTHVTPEALLHDLAVVRQRGWALDNAENEENLRCIGAPVRDASGSAIGGVSISAMEFELPVERLDEIAALVAAAGSGISENLGYQRSEASR